MSDVVYVKPEDLEEVLSKNEVIGMFYLAHYEIPAGNVADVKKYPAGSLTVETLVEEINGMVKKVYDEWGSLIGNPLAAAEVSFDYYDENHISHKIMVKNFSDREKDYLVIDGLADYVVEDGNQ